MSTETVTRAPGGKLSFPRPVVGRWAVGGEQRLEVTLNMTEFSPLTSCVEKSKDSVLRAQISVLGLTPCIR